MPRDVRFEALLLVPCLARCAMVAAAAAFPYARGEGVGVAFHDAAWPGAVLVGGAVAVAAAVALLGAGGLLAVAFAAACALAVGAYARGSIGGMTGDLYGATVEISEALLFCSSQRSRLWLDESAAPPVARAQRLYPVPAGGDAHMLTLILGGARSGKSDLALRLAAASGRDVLFVATMEPGDDELRLRVEQHRAERPAAWRTVEAPRDVASALAMHAAGRRRRRLRDAVSATC
jgi:hypothetical protein